MKKISQNPMYKFLMVLTIFSAIGLQGWRSIFNNFAIDVAGLDGHQVGIIQAFREVPGFLTFLVIFVLFFIKEHRLAILAIFLLVLGIGITGFFPSFYGIILTTFLMSIGFHYYETVNKSLVIQYFNKKISPLVFAKQKSLAAITNIFIGLVIFFVSFYLSYQQIFLCLGGIVFVAVIWAFFQDPVDKDILLQQKKLIFKKKYSLFYILTFLSGARRQIFMAFAVFLLAKKFDFTVQEITLLFVVNNLINYFLSPFIGKAIVRFGERKVLSLEYFSLIFIFLFYTYATSKIFLMILYILDHIFFNFALAIQTYFQKIGDPKDFASGTAVGFAINHIAAVIFPVIGGILWIIDYRIPFFIGAFFSLLSFLAVQKIK